MARVHREINKTKLTASDIISAICLQSILNKTKSRYYPNYYIGHWECDVLEVTKDGYTCEYEVKISKSDFRSDFLKQNKDLKKYDSLKSGNRVNYFYYVVPDGLIDVSDIPDYAGLIYAIGCDGNILNNKGDIVCQKRVIFSIIKEPKVLKIDKITPEEIDIINKRIYFKYHMLRLNQLANTSFFR